MLGNAKSAPEELSEVIIWKQLGIPLAKDALSLDKVPSRFVDDWLILQAGISDAEEWQRLNPKK